MTPLPRNGAAPLLDEPTPRFTRGEADRWIGLTLEHTAQLLVLDTLLRFMVGMHDHLVMSRVLPGVGLALILGNLGAAAIAKRQASDTEQVAVPVLGVGLDMASIFLICFLVVLPMRALTDSSFPAWQVGAAATVLVGLVQCLSIFAPERAMDEMSRAAVLSPVGALAFLFLALPAVFGIFTIATLLLAIVAVVALWVVARVRLEHGLPAGLLVLVVCAWAAWLVGLGGAPTQSAPIGVRLPLPAIEQVFGAIKLAQPAWLAMGVAAGVFCLASTARQLRTHRDRGGHTTDLVGHSLLGFASVVGGFTGAIVPVTFVELPAVPKANLVRTRFLIPALVVVVALCFTGALAAIVRMLPTEAALAVVVWLGLASAARGMDLYDLDADDAVKEPAPLITRPKRERAPPEVAEPKQAAAR